MRGRWSAMCGCRQRLQPQFTVKNPSLHSGFSLFFSLCSLQPQSCCTDLQQNEERKQDGGEAGERVLASAGSNIYA